MTLARRLIQMVASKQKPLITVVGTTGVGKSRLAIEVARGAATAGWTGGKVINADAMQMYDGLDIITNKVTEEEKCGVEHLLLGVKKPGEEYVVGDFVADASSAIDRCHQENTLPIAAGGTTYWIQHLIFPQRLMSKSHELSEPHAMSPQLSEDIALLPAPLLHLWESLADISTAQSFDPDLAFSLHSLLSRLDPPIAQRWHWKDTRKVLRSLEIIQENGCRASDLVSRQAEHRSDPRYRTLIFWLYAEPSKLEPRLDSRIDEMIERGLLSEIRTLQGLASSLDQHEGRKGSIAEHTQGIFQSIGYKEFAPYFAADGASEELFVKCVDQMKLATRKYARKQVKWIRNQLLPAVHDSNVSLFLLNATDLSTWESEVKDLAVKLTIDFLAEHELPDPLTLSDVAGRLLRDTRTYLQPSQVMQARQKRVCPTCTLDPTRPILLEEGREWEVHRKTRAHRRLEGKEQRLKEVEEKRREKARRDEEKDKAGKDKEDSPNESLSSIDILY